MSETTASDIASLFEEELFKAGWRCAQEDSYLFWRNANHIGTRSIKTAVVDAIQDQLLRHLQIKK